MEVEILSQSRCHHSKKKKIAKYRGFKSWIPFYLIFIVFNFLPFFIHFVILKVNYLISNLGMIERKLGFGFD